MFEMCGGIGHATYLKKGKMTIGSKIDCSSRKRSGPRTGLKKNEATEVKKRESSFPKLGAISPVKSGSFQWLPSLLLIMSSLGHGEEKQRGRPPPPPPRLPLRLPTSPPLHPPSEHQSAAPTVSKRQKWHLTCNFICCVWSSCLKYFTQ